MAIIRIYTGSDGKSHFEEIHPRFESRGDRSKDDPDEHHRADLTSRQERAPCPRHHVALIVSW